MRRPGGEERCKKPLIRCPGQIRGASHRLGEDIQAWSKIQTMRFFGSLIGL